MINLESVYCRQIKDLVAQIYPEAKVYVYGSRVKGNNKKYSDVDLLIKHDGDFSLIKYGQLQEAFEESNLPYIVDFHDSSLLGKDFSECINDNLVLI